MTAALLAQYTERKGIPMWPAMLLTSSNLPRGLLRRCGRVAWQIFQLPQKLVSMITRARCISILSTAPAPPTPAQ